MIVWAIADRALDIVGLFAILLWTIKGTLKFSRWWGGKKSASPQRPRVERL